MTRRELLASASAALVYPPKGITREMQPEYKMGIATTSYMIVWRPHDTYEFLEHCHALGAAGIQSALNGDMKKIRARAEECGMFIEAMLPLPKHRDDTTELEQALKNAKEVGATCGRAGSLPSRRYETFSTLEEWKEWYKNATEALETAVPLLEKYKFPLGLENHKDRAVDEHVALLKKFSSPYLGACIDCGNNISLLDDPMDVIEKLAPFGVTTHFKDMAVAPYPDGFLLSEVVLGQGMLDLPRVLSTIKQAKPNIHIMLEMISRDPLKVPVLTDKYWATFPDRNGIYLARTLRLVQKSSDPSKPLPEMSHLPHEEQMRAEEDNVKACLRYAHEKLAL